MGDREREKELKDRWSLRLPAPEREAIEEELAEIQDRAVRAKRRPKVKR